MLTELSTRLFPSCEFSSWQAQKIARTANKLYNDFFISVLLVGGKGKAKLLYLPTKIGVRTVFIGKGV